MSYSGLAELRLQDEAVASYVALARGETSAYLGEFSVGFAELKWANLVLVVVLEKND